MMDAPAFVALEKSRTLEHAEVPRDRRRGNTIRRRQIADRGLAAREPRHDAAPDGVGQGREDFVQGAGTMINH
jgi:hypothetical protein